MANKILLVDDGKLFLQSLKQELGHLSDIFETDICFSVSEAIQHIKTTHYDPIITDIRMPFKSGIDLLLYLKMNDFSGGIKVMSAHANDENLAKINAFGVIGVISKPFDFEWFEDIIIDFFKKRKCVLREVELERGIYIGYSYSIYQVSEGDCLVLVTDISNKKIFLETKEENQYFNKLETFMAEISHEIGNPLTSVIMKLQVLLKNIPDWSIKEKREYIQQSINELKRLSKFLKKIRDLSRENKIERKPVLLKSIIERLISQNRALLDTKTISFINDVDETVKVNVNEDAFYQVLFNLFQNSIDSFSATVIKKVIRVNNEEVSAFFVKFIYKNNGSPIPVDILEKMEWRS